MMKLKSNLINVEIEDIKETINKALETKFEKGKDSNQFYEKIYEKFMKVKENYFNLTKQETEKEIVKESEITSEEIKKINESLRKLRKKAETTIDYKHLPYEQLKDTYLPNLEERIFTPTRNIVRFVNAIIETRNSNLTKDILIKIIKKKTNRDVYSQLEIEVLINPDYTTYDIIRFFLKNYASPRELEENLMEYHKKIGNLKDCFKNDDHRNLDMKKSIIAIQLIEQHIIGLNSVIRAKELYEEFIGNSNLAFQNNLLNYNHVIRLAEQILPNSLCYELINDVNGDHEKQITWIIKKLEEIKSRSEKARLIGFNKRDSQEDMMRTTLNFIEKKLDKQNLNINTKKNQL